jgi:tRNA(Ile)-lysidine synthase
LSLLARCTFPPAGTPLDCGVSGGADSLALLALALEAGCLATAVHVDHGVRPGSADEAEAVAAAAARLGAGFKAVRVQVRSGPDLEARARAARHAALGPEAAFGHTADDRAETLLVNLLRGAGPAGLAALRPGPRHPILGLRRAETRALCADLGLEPFEDPSNADPRFVRNRLRHEVLPLLAAVAGRDVVPLLVRTTELAGADDDLLDALAAAVEVTDAPALAAAPPPLAARAVRRWLAGDGHGPGGPERHPPDRATVERVLGVAGGAAVACELPGGWRVARTAQTLRLERPPGP